MDMKYFQIIINENSKQRKPSTHGGLPFSNMALPLLATGLPQALVLAQMGSSPVCHLFQSSSTLLPTEIPASQKAFLRNCEKKFRKLALHL